MGLSVKSQAGAASDRDVHMEIGIISPYLPLSTYQTDKCRTFDGGYPRSGPETLPRSSVRLYIDGTPEHERKESFLDLPGPGGAPIYSARIMSTGSAAAALLAGMSAANMPPKDKRDAAIKPVHGSFGFTSNKKTLSPWLKR
jgi:hypothetical protein